MRAVSAETLSQLLVLRQALLLGVQFAVLYDALRLFRRVFRHGMFWISAEDFAYWVYVATAEFMLLYQKSNGVLRIYIFIGTVVGALLYHLCIGRWVMLFCSRWILRMKKRSKQNKD